MFYYRIGLSLLCCTLLAPYLFAEDGDVFLSLTRKYEPLRDLPTNVSVISSADIATRNAGNLGELLESAVGLRRSQTGTLGQESTLMIRGASPQQTLVLIDGRPSNSISLGSADLSAIPTDSIDHIEIIRGAASSVYGANAFGGAVNIITKRPTESVPTLQLSLSPGSYGSQNFTADCGVRKDALYGMVTAERRSTDGWRKNSDYEGNDFFARLGYNAGSFGQFDFTGSLFRNEMGVPGCAYKNIDAIRADPVNTVWRYLSVNDYNGSLEKDALSPDARQKENREYARLENARSWETNSLRTVLYASNDKLTYNDPYSVLNNEYDSTVFGGELQFNTVYGITAGTEWNEEDHQRLDLNAGTTMIDRSRVTTAVYLQDELKWANLSFIPSVRFDDNSAFGNVLSPRITAVCQVSDDVKLSANSGRVWRAPTFNELFFRDDVWMMYGNPDLKPEEGISSDIGLEYRRNSFTAAFTLFRSDTDNLIIWEYDPATFKTTASNVNRSRHEGMEFEFSQQLMQDLVHRFNYTYLRAEDTDTHAQLTYRPHHAINYTVSYRLPSQARLGLGAEYVSRQKTGVSYAPELPEYLLVSLSIAQRFYRNVELWARGDNILNTKYQTRLGFPLPGTTVSGGVSIRFQG